MKQGIGSVFLYNIIIVFIVITFGFLAATLSYMKAFKVNSRIAYSLERHEGYNYLSNNEINDSLSTLGYRVNTSNVQTCKNRSHTINGKTKTYSAVPFITNNYLYCIYEYDKVNGYFSYGIVTYIFVDIPILGGTFKVPVYSESERIYEFNKN
ncbi:MAG: hypothetical protein ACK5HP_04905 [Bacilli bacterium]